MADEKQKPPPFIPEWQRDMAAAEPPGFMAGVLQDARNGISQNLSTLPCHMLADERLRAPGAGTIELKPPAGINYVDAIAESFARVDRAALLKERLEAALLAKLEAEAKK